MRVWPRWGAGSDKVGNLGRNGGQAFLEAIWVTEVTWVPYAPGSFGDLPWSVIRSQVNLLGEPLR